MRLDNRTLIGGVAACAAVATFHGAAHAAGSSGVVSPIDLLYPVMGDGLALVAWRTTQEAQGRLRGFAWVVMVLAASASGLAQAYVLTAGKQGGAAVLAAGMGAAPAACVLLATVLASGALRPELLGEHQADLSLKAHGSSKPAVELNAEPVSREPLRLASPVSPGEPERVTCTAGCGRQVSVATRKRHKSKGCPAAA